MLAKELGSWCLLRGVRERGSQAGRGQGLQDGGTQGLQAGLGHRGPYGRGPGLEVQQVIAREVGNSFFFVAAPMLASFCNSASAVTQGHGSSYAKGARRLEGVLRKSSRGADIISLEGDLCR